jgi:NitT/TauT family transport system substrate-binding protein
MNGQPRGPFYAVLALVIAGLVAFAIYRADIFAPGGGQPALNPIDPAQLGHTAESPDGAPLVTTVKEYTFSAAERLPEIKGTSAFKPLEDATVKFALNVWAGWAPIVQANNGFKAEKVWRTPAGKPFKVELVLIDDPAAMIAAYAAGEVHIGWGTLDMLPLFVDGMVDKSGRPKDSRVMPRIFQQVDWSNGGDGIVVRKTVKTVADLRGKTMVLAQNSPSQYFALNMLVAGGVQPSEVQMVYTNTAFEAAAAFNANRNIAAAVSWAPDIYNLEKIEGNRMLVTTQTANKLIADVWFARADFASENMDLCEGIVRGIFDGMEALKDKETQANCAKLMGEGYNMPAEDVMGMFADAHSTNWAENYQFFLNQNNPTNFEKIWRQSYYLYRQIGTIQNTPVRFDQVMDFSIIQKLGKEEKYAASRDEYQIQLAPKTVGEIRAESPEILTNTVVIHFFPNDWDLYKKVTQKVDGKDVESLYDPNVDNVLEGAAKLVGQFGAARVIIEGHTDASMRGQVPVDVVRQLSMNRANAVREALVKKYNLEPNRFMVDGMGWDRPANAGDPLNHAKNRRVEIKVYPAEAM